MTPGDDFVDPLIKRGEELERLIAAGLGDPALSVAQDELRSIKDIARARIAHTQQFPFASTSAEESAQYLAQQEARSAREREEAALKVLRTLGRLGGPLLLAMLKAELTKGLEAAHLPPALAPFVDVVREAAEGAAGKLLDDVAR